ncbi:hypothetical protein P3T36_001255 [Kitasatospora sp. MAP12-15]|uniref:hypothetical protein n=1 Tax=unclassified Kitasatospora TaxID=2633591 RepID=UPI0024733D3E|nr:hypothetical protein [Kitasatospora sp. MAP12-44]MDH6114906.1 hypothetical protein [Kitasatospora sp. MAP12-44]
MGIFDRFRSKAHEHADPAERAALAHDEAADAFAVDIEKSAESAQAKPQQADEDRLAAENMTAEGDPWG